MEPKLKNLVISDGQVAASAGVILSGPGDWARRFNLTFTNAGSTAEVLVLTFSRASGTQRQLRRVELEADETFELTGLPLNKADSVYAVTTNALTVDYLVSVAPDEAPLSSQVYGPDGLAKTSPYIIEQLAAVLS